MGDVDNYVKALPVGPNRSELERLHALVLAHVPGVGQRTSYNMPTYVYREKGLASIVVHKAHIGWYPHSGTVIEPLGKLVESYSFSPGTLRFTPEQPLSDEIVLRLLDSRMHEIDEFIEARTKKPRA